MKAAMEAWGAERNLFHQGFARETRDPAIVAATAAQPGVVLKRSVGSRGAFREHADLPKSLPVEKLKNLPKPKLGGKVAKPKAAAKVANLAEAAQLAAAAIEKARARREAEDRKREAAERREHAMRVAASAKAEKALERARQRHDAIMQKVKTVREALDRRVEVEQARWNREKRTLEEKLRQTRE